MTETAEEHQRQHYPGSHAASEPDKAAVVMAPGGEIVTYAELDELANRLSQLLRTVGLERGDHVAFCLENRAEFLPIAWGCHYAGVYYTAISSRLTSEELSYIINDCGAKAFITSPSRADVVAEIVDDIPDVKLRLSVGGIVDGFESFEDAIAACPAEPLADRLESTDMLYSSGTTGRPKGVKVPMPDAPLGTANPLLQLASALFGVDHDAVYLSPAPLYHSAPLRFCMAVHRVGGTVIAMERFDPEHALRLIEQYRVTTSQWVPTMFVRMLKLPEGTRSQYDISSLRVAIHAAAPCPVAVKEQMIDWWGPVLHEYYAGTEGNGFCYTGSEDWLAHKGTVGRPLIGELHIVDDHGNEVPAGTEGTIYFGGGGGFEYHNDVEKTHGSRHPAGWSTLGDVGKVDEDGFLYLTDRKAYMIISGGVNIYPQETENILTMHPDVFDVAVIGVPNDDFGEEVKAVVQPVTMPADDDASAALERILIAYCRDHLADVKCPRSVDFRPELPRHPTGKLYKRLLKDEYWSGRETRI
ncbi:MAG: AMP-binding protein [Acidimicrobiia bacterium]|nr:AMP-binding protein [Acidimicrobiia bacterium]